MENILKVLVGSHAHGLARPESDSDFRGVFVVRTRELLAIGGATKQVNWTEGNDDDTSYEVGHFLHLALKSNPSILEVFKSPVIESNEWGDQLISLFPYVWDSRAVRDAFIGYSRNQQKKMFDKELGDHQSRRWKYATAYIRVLYMAKDLLSTGDFSVDTTTYGEYGGEPVFEGLKAIRAGQLSIGAVVNWAESLQDSINKVYENTPRHEANIEKINEFLLDLRRKFW